MSTKQLVKAAVSVNMPKAARKKKPEKPAKSILFEFKNQFNEAGPPIQRGYPHWTEVLFLLILITSISMVFVSKDNVESKGELDNSLLASVGIWMATAVSFITMYYNFGLFDRKRNAASAEYLEGHVQEMIKYNEDLFSLTNNMDEINEKNKKTQAKAEMVRTQLSHVAEYLGGAKKIVSMLNSGLDQFLKENMKQLEKQEKQVRESQINMMDRGLDRISELLIFSFCGIDKDKNAVLEGAELGTFFKKLQKYQLCQTKDAFFDHFPIGLDIDLDDGTLLDKVCAAGAKKGGFNKDKFLSDVKGILADEDDDSDLTFMKDEHKQKYLSLLKDHGIVSSDNEYFDKLHGIDRYLILEGMNERTTELKELARTVLVEYDQVMKELNDKEAELKKSHPSEGTLTKIELDADVLNAAKESSAPASKGKKK